MAGKVVTGVKAEPDTWDSEGFGRSDEGDENKASQGIDGCGFSRGKVDDFEPPTGKMASLSLAERVKEKYGDTSAAALPVRSAHCPPRSVLDACVLLGMTPVDEVQYNFFEVIAALGTGYVSSIAR